MILLHFYKINNLIAPVLDKKPTPNQMNLIKNAKDQFFVVEKLQKYRKCPALQSI